MHKQTAVLRKKWAVISEIYFFTGAEVGGMYSNTQFSKWSTSLTYSWIVPIRNRSLEYIKNQTKPNSIVLKYQADKSLEDQDFYQNHKIEYENTPSLALMKFNNHFIFLNFL